MTPVGLARARDLANGRELSLETLKRMSAYFTRHAIDAKAEGWGKNSKGYQAWLGWGGVPPSDGSIPTPENDKGWAWVQKQLAKVNQDSEVWGTSASKPAPPADQIRGSDRNEPSSASSTRGGIKLNDQIVKALKDKAIAHNKTSKHKVTLGMLKAVYRRGAGAYSTSHDPKLSRGAWAMARVNAFLKLVKHGKPANPKYTGDNDLLPRSHKLSPKYRKQDALPRQIKGYQCGNSCISRSKICQCDPRQGFAYAALKDLITLLTNC